VAPGHSASIRKGHDLKRRPMPPAASKKEMQPSRVIRVIPVSGSVTFPGIYLKVGADWDFLFLSLMNWLPELEGINIKDQNKVMIQYKTGYGWKPLAGNEQLNKVLNEFSNLQQELYVRCAPEDEFESGSDKDEDDDVAIIGSYKRGSGSLLSAYKEDKQTVGPATTSLLSCGSNCAIANGEYLEGWSLLS